MCLMLSTIYFLNNELNCICFYVIRNKKIAEVLDLDFGYMEKKRFAADQPTILSLHADVRNKVVVIVDDIIDTGRTAVRAADFLLKEGAKSIIGCFTHGVLSSGAVERVENSSFDKIFITDTIVPRDFSSSKINIVSSNDFIMDFINLMLGF